ncbi:hypothetical protein [Streptomyces adustus]|uniref:hypothetical protein n=1 Tax=Streptomyces adustus TaxID=1609272 RepID=UPI0012E07E8F|nr:hypothetical protein [Streptomyces adustus]
MQVLANAGEGFAQQASQRRILDRMRVEQLTQAAGRAAHHRPVRVERCGALSSPTA